MKLLGAKRCRCLRWALYTLTLLALLAIPASIWTPQRLSMSRTGESRVRYSMSFSLQQCHIRVHYTDVYHMYAKPSWSFSLVPKQYVRPNPDLHWWELPSVSLSKSPSASMQVITSLDIRVPLVYLAPLLVASSFVLIRRAQKRSAAGHCAVCGYDLADLESNACPECGADHA